MLRFIGTSSTGVRLYQPIDKPNFADGTPAIFSIGLRFRCGGTVNEWRIVWIDADHDLITVVRDYPNQASDKYTWNYRSAIQQGYPLLHETTK